MNTTTNTVASSATADTDVTASASPSAANTSASGSGTRKSDQRKSDKRKRFHKAPARTVAITIVAGTTISCAVANVTHPESGVIVTIKGNPNGFIPNRLLAGKTPAAKDERRRFLLANPGTQIEVFVDTAAMAAPKAAPKTEKTSDIATTTSNDSQVNSHDSSDTPKLRPRIILNEDKIVVGKIIRARQEANASVRQTVAALATGETMFAQVQRFATKQNDNDDGRHFIGLFVTLANGLPAFLHKSRMLKVNGEYADEGDMLYVAIASAEMDGNRAMVRVEQVELDPKDLASAAEPLNAAPASSSAPASAETRSASQMMWDNVAAFHNQGGSGPVVVIDPSV